jgi:ubiquinone biosynthesis protein UbiJ
VDASIEGPLERLISCAGGQGDGDAMFFAREIRVTGNSDLMVALRNALDDAEIDFAEEAAALAGPFAGPARGALGRAGRLYRHLQDRLDAAKAEVTGPLEARLDAQAQELAELRSEVARLRRRQPRQKRTSAGGGRSAAGSPEEQSA